MLQPNKAKFILRLLDSFKANEDKVAVVDQNGQRQTTYKELFTNACRVAAYLQQKQYPPHSFIGICLPTSMEYVASEIGIWLAGHAIVPMGDKYPQDRIDYIMHHCESPLLINDDVIKAMMKTEPTDNYVLPDEDDVITNPALIISSYKGFGDNLKVNSSSSDSIDLTLRLDEKSSARFVLKHIVFSDPSGEKKDFTLDVKSLGSDYVVTDLR